MRLSNCLNKSSSSSRGACREDLENRAQKQTALKTSQASETALHKRGREEELFSQKRRKLNAPSECQITSEKRSVENEQAEIDWDSLPDIEGSWGSKQAFAEDTNFASNIFAEGVSLNSETIAAMDELFSAEDNEKAEIDCEPLSGVEVPEGQKLAFAEDTNCESNIFLEEDHFDSETIATPDKLFSTLEEQSEGSTFASETLRVFNGNTNERDIVDDAPYDMELLTCSNDSIYEETPRKEVSASGKAIAPKRKRVSKANSIRFVSFPRTFITIIYFANGDRYEGDITENLPVKQLPNGKKESICSTEAEYKDALVNGTFHEKVELIYEGKNRFNELRNYVSKGNGSLYLADGTVIEGDIYSLSFDGSGKITYPDKSHYVGCFYNKQPHGLGTFFCADGEVYKGTFANGKLQGKTEVILRGHIRYVGNFVNGNPTSEGSLYLPDGTVYESIAWRRDLSFGFGKITYPDKTVYEGAFSTPVCRTNDLSK